MKDKKKGIIIALAAFCLVAAIGCAVGAAVVKKSAADGAKTLSFSTLPDGTDISDTADVYANVKSATVKGAPDTYIKAAYIKKVDSKISQFNLIKTYDAFRLYDVVNDGGLILCVYAEGDKAVITSSEAYKTNDERAKLISRAIERLDKNYETLVKLAKLDNVKPENILY